jgi:hypothetical protein
MRLLMLRCTGVQLGIEHARVSFSAPSNDPAAASYLELSAGNSEALGYVPGRDYQLSLAPAPLAALTEDA